MHAKCVCERARACMHVIICIAMYVRRLGISMCIHTRSIVHMYTYESDFSQNGRENRKQANIRMD